MIRAEENNQTSIKPKLLWVRVITALSLIYFKNTTMDDSHKHDNIEARSFQDRPLAGTVSSVSNLDWRTDLEKRRA